MNGLGKWGFNWNIPTPPKWPVIGKVKKVPTPPEFWRREKRVKIIASVDIIVAKEELRELATEIKRIQPLIEKLIEEHHTTVHLYYGILSQRRWFLEHCGSVPEGLTTQLKVADKNKRQKQKEVEVLQNARMRLMQLYQQKTQHILDLRNTERSTRK